jgi:hypothetical protein
MDINVERAKDAGVEIATIFNTMQVLWWFVPQTLTSLKAIPRNDSGKS